MQDHCHKTGLKRGALCGCCNAAIGMLGEDLVTIQRAIEYLRPIDCRAHASNRVQLIRSGEPRSGIVALG